MHWGTTTEPVTLDMHQAIAELVTRSPVSESVTSSSKGGQTRKLRCSGFSVPGRLYKLCSQQKQAPEGEHMNLSKQSHGGLITAS